MYDLATIKQLNKEAVDRATFPRLNAAEPRLHPLVAAAIISIETGQPIPPCFEPRKSQPGE